MDKEKEVVGINKDQQATNSNSNENSSTKNSDEAGATSIQDCAAKATKQLEEDKQVEPEGAQVKVEKIDRESTKGSSIEDAFRANKEVELSEMQQNFKTSEQQKKTLQNELATLQHKFV